MFIFRSFLIRNLNHFSLLAGLIIIDRLTKYLIRLYGGFYLCNQGITWGIILSEPVFKIFWIIIIALILFAIIKVEPGVILYCLIFILAGAVSNMIDRVIFGCVIDFIDIHVWPVFNLADLFIVLGGISLLAKYLKP